MLGKLKDLLFGKVAVNGTDTNGNGMALGGRASKSTAKSRLSFVLVQDRTGLTNDEMAKFKSEMVSVIERYFSIDEQRFDISYKRDGETTTLLINSPVIVRRKDSKKSQAAAK